MGGRDPLGAHIKHGMPENSLWKPLGAIYFSNCASSLTKNEGGRGNHIARGAAESGTGGGLLRSGRPGHGADAEGAIADAAVAE
jgi:hypothetical protein